MRSLIPPSPCAWCGTVHLPKYKTRMNLRALVHAKPIVTFHTHVSGKDGRIAPRDELANKRREQVEFGSTSPARPA